MGDVPENTDKTLGQCSQMATFVRKDMLQFLNKDVTNNEATPSISLIEIDPDVIFPIEKYNYKLLFSKIFPYDQDARTNEEKIMDDAKYFINRHLYDDDGYFNDEKNICEFPVIEIFQCVHEAADLNEFRTILCKEFVINENDCVVHKVYEDTWSDCSEHGVENDEEANKENDASCAPNDLSTYDEDWD